MFPSSYDKSHVNVRLDQNVKHTQIWMNCNIKNLHYIIFHVKTICCWYQNKKHDFFKVRGGEMQQLSMVPVYFSEVIDCPSAHRGVPYKSGLLALDTLGITQSSFQLKNLLGNKKRRAFDSIAHCEVAQFLRKR